MATATTTAFREEETPAQGTLESAGAGITGGYTGDSLSLKIIIAYLIGLALYNAVELMIMIFVTFNKYRGLYFWSLLVAGFGVIPYSLGFLIKFFHLLDPNQSVGYIAVILLTLGWYMMVSGQSVVLWSRLHLVTNSRRVLNWTLWMIIINGTCLHVTTSVLTFGANANTLSRGTLQNFVTGYSVMEKIQMAGFYIQELILSLIYIKETIRLLKLSESVANSDGRSAIDDGSLRSGHMKKVMYQLVAINVIIVAMDTILLSVELANYYLIEVVLKGAVYSIKLKLEFAVLSRLVQLVRTKSQSGGNSGGQASSSSTNRRGTGDTGLTLEKSRSRTSVGRSTGHANDLRATASYNSHYWPDFVDPRYVSSDVTRAEPAHLHGEDTLADLNEAWEVMETERWRRRSRVARNSWIGEEMDRHNIG